MAGVVVLLITLVVLGGYFLYRSLPGNTNAVVNPEADSKADVQADSAESHVLHIAVVGDSSEVLVRIPGGEVLTHTEMHAGEYASFDQPELDVTIGDPTAVEVHVNGALVDISGEDSGYSFTAEGE